MGNSTVSRTGKKIGRPATGAESIHLRVLPDQSTAIDAWIAKQKEPDLTRPEAIRRLVELGLAGSSECPRVLSTSKQSATRAAELAAKTIEKHLDPKALLAERAARKRKLVEGPGVFRESRKDLPSK